MECAYDPNIVYSRVAFGAQKRLIVHDVVENMDITFVANLFATIMQFLANAWFIARYDRVTFRKSGKRFHNKQSAFYISVSWKLYQTGDNLFSYTVRFRIFHGNSDLMRYPQVTTTHWITRSEGLNWGSGTSNVSQVTGIGSQNWRSLEFRMLARSRHIPHSFLKMLKAGSRTPNKELSSCWTNS